MTERYLPLLPLNAEGAPPHPQGIFIHCGCDKCEERWQKQLKAHEDYWRAREMVN